MASKTLFCYGIPVTNESLTFATMAYERLDGPFRFIRLVQKRIREGTLQTAQTSAVALFPTEIWDLVRHKVTDLELDAAERTFLDRHGCEHGSDACGCDCDACPATKWADVLDCCVCLEDMIEYHGFRGFAMTAFGPSHWTSLPTPTNGSATSCATCTSRL